MVHYRNIINPCNALSDDAGCTSTRATAGSRQRRVSTSGSSVSEPISRSSQKATTLPFTRGPVATERLQLGNGFVPLPGLGSPMARHSTTTPHASQLPRFSSLGHQLRAACTCKPPGVMAVRSRCALEGGEESACFAKMPMSKNWSDVAHHTSEMILSRLDNLKSQNVGMLWQSTTGLRSMTHMTYRTIRFAAT
jgi:hypothetical protein